VRFVPVVPVWIEYVAGAGEAGAQVAREPFGPVPAVSWEVGEPDWHLEGPALILLGLWAWGL